MNLKVYSTVLNLVWLIFIVSGVAHADVLSTTYYHSNALGSPVAATDESGAIKWREQYRPYGERMLEEAEALDNTRWYTGHPQDEETGLVYAGARYYDPVVGRFMGIDAAGVMSNIEFNQSIFNRYAYANNSPYSYVDPDGNFSIAVKELWVGTPTTGMGYEWVLNLDLTTSRIEIWGERADNLIKRNRQAEKISRYVTGGRVGPEKGSSAKDIAHIDTLLESYLRGNRLRESRGGWDYNWSIIDFQQTIIKFYEGLGKADKKLFKKMYGSPWNMQNDGGLISDAKKQWKKSIDAKTKLN